MNDNVKNIGPIIESIRADVTWKKVFVTLDLLYEEVGWDDEAGELKNVIAMKGCVTQVCRS